MEYQEAVEILTSVNKFQIKMGLERVITVLKIIGNPQEKIKIIHIAGTNGKGSVCSILANILKCSGYKIGLYTSPHLIEYTERIKINGVEISRNDFSNLISEINNISEKNRIDLTEFETLTVAAFKYFAENKVDFAIMETGLGGRFDATNASNLPLYSIITSISKDHTDRLGDTIKKIAYEKAGIIKYGVPVIISKFNKGYKVIEKEAKIKKSELITVENNIEMKYEHKVNYVVKNGKKYEFSLIGTYQSENLALVFKIIDLLNAKGVKIDLEEGLKTVKWRARLEYNREKNLITDGAHNPSGAAELKKSLDYYFKGEKKIYIYSTINTKDYNTIAKILFNKEDEIYYYEFNHKNAVTLEEYKQNVNFLDNIKPFTKEVLQRKELKVITGSLYMIGEFMKNNNI